ncbi:MAG: hypothetical protein FJ351_07075, partial [Sphingomonadales bacterium]|nr:hypothetical protein [Sphingomonadales bacterium]
RFVVTASSNLEFDLATVGNCEYNDVNADIIPNTQFVNGGVTALQAVTTTATMNLPYGGSVTVCGQVFNTAGVFSVTCTAANGCDSIINLTLISNPVEIKAGQVTALCPGDVVTVPLTINHGLNIGAISFALNYNTSNLTYQGYNSLNPGLSNNFLINNINGQIRMAWFDLNPVNFPSNATLFNLVFQANDSGSLVWNTSVPGDCEVGNNFGDLIPSQFINGSVLLGGVRSVITASSSPNLCTGDQVVLSGPVSSNAAYQWNLNGTSIAGATSNTLTVATAGSYTLTINSGQGCVSTSNAIAVSIRTRPTANITASGLNNGLISVCQGSSVTLTANTGTGFSYQWQLNGSNIIGATSSTFNIAAATNTNQGTYTVIVTNNSEGNGCSATSTGVALTIKSPATSNISENLPYGGSITLCGQTFNSSGTFTVVCSGAASNGCDSIITLTLNVASAIITNIGNTTGCVGDTVSIPVQVQYGNGIGAISLALNYNASALSFIGFENANPAIQSSNLLVNA